MISWIQLTFQKHFRIVFAVLLGVIIISFIFTIGATPGIGRGDRQVAKRPFFGYNLSSQEDAQRISQETNLSVMLRAGYMALDGQQFDDFMQHRVAALDLAKKLKIPAPTQEQLVEYIKTLRGFQDQQGQFDAARYAQFLGNLKTNPQLTEANVSRVLSDDYRIDLVQKRLSGPGYVLPEDIKTQLARADSSWTLGIATVDYATYPNPPVPSDAELNKYFEENGFRYEVPPRINASYVVFNAADFMNGVVLKEDEVKAYYDANPARFPKPVNPAAAAKPADKISDLKVDSAPKPAEAAADFAAVKPQVETALKHEKAGKAAAKAAADFTLALYNQKLTIDSPALSEFLTARHLKLSNLPPIRKDAPDAGLPIPPTAVEEVFKLGPQRFFSDPISNSDGNAFVIFWKQTLPSYKPPLAEVKTQVLADYQDTEKRKKFAEAGKTLKTNFEAALKAGTPFDKAVAGLSGAGKDQPKIEGKEYPAFTLRQPPQDIPYSALGSLEHLDAGQVSDLVMAKDKGFLVFVREKKLPTFSAENPQYVTAKTQLAQHAASVTGMVALNELISEEVAKAEPVR